HTQQENNLRVLDGVNCVLIGYGQTGSGKSFTIGGLKNNWEVRISHHLLRNVTVVDAENVEETLRKILEGEARRSIVNGTMYPVSHLGAAVITIHVSNASLIKSQAVVATAKIHIVEMAGTGTVGKSSCWKTAADLGMANLMKIQLEQYFLHLRKPSMCTYSVVHSSNLLKLLKDALTVTSVIR
ncbi:uncharacterized protein, partial [Temnothorax nylanderi]|uniref:uncharacterized protein n=1 Tax=Temnothorax nylanderi TaxID=102681 RepID=UPI003A883423